MEQQLNVWRRDARSGAARLLLVLCHGVAANGQDLIGLAAPWAAALPDVAFIAPDAPEPCDMAPYGRQWFSLQDRTPSVLEAGARRTAPLLLGTVAAELARLGLPPGAVALMGFSQGAMMVLHAGLRRKVPPAAILAYSGALLDSPALDLEMTGKPPVLLVHGEKDKTAPIEHAEAMRAALIKANHPPEWMVAKNEAHGFYEMLEAFLDKNIGH